MYAVSKKKINAKVAAYLRRKVNVFGEDDANCMIALQKRICPTAANAKISLAKNCRKRTGMKTQKVTASRLKI